MGAFSEILIENPDFHIDGILIEDAIYDDIEPDEANDPIYDDIEPDEANDPIYDVDVDEIRPFRKYYKIIGDMHKEMKK